MIRNSFIFLEKIGAATEKNIWKQRILNWDDFLKAKNIKGISLRRKSYYDRKIIQARNALYNLDSSYFLDKLPLNEMWRLYNFFSDDAVFLDIEASGVTSKDDDITVFGMFDGINTKIMIKGVNLDYPIIKKELRKYKLIVTFNGSSFDIPFIKKRYPDLIPNIPHFDINSVAHRIGLKGGLKKIEKNLGIKRNLIIDKLYSGDPKRLWKMFRASGNKYYLNLLVEYNEEDIINLKKIAGHCVKKLSSEYKNYNKHKKI